MCDQCDVRFACATVELDEMLADRGRLGLSRSPAEHSLAAHVHAMNMCLTSEGIERMAGVLAAAIERLYALECSGIPTRLEDNS